MENFGFVRCVNIHLIEYHTDSRIAISELKFEIGFKNLENS